MKNIDWGLVLMTFPFIRNCDKKKQPLSLLLTFFLTQWVTVVPAHFSGLFCLVWQYFGWDYYLSHQSELRLYNSNIKNYFDRKIIFGTTTPQAFGAKAPVSNPRDNAIYSHWYMKSNHHPADVPTCGRLCSKEQNQDCEVKDLKVKEGAEFKCTGHQMKRTKAWAVLNFTFF